MALAQALLTALELLLFSLAFASFGNLILRALSSEFHSDGEHLLVAIALGIISTEILLFFAQITQHIRSGSFAIIVILCLTLVVEYRAVLRKARNTLSLLRPSSVALKAFRWAIILVLIVEFLISCAPLTGSDAQDYHFNAQKLFLERGFHPLFSNVHTFLCGQHHSLILFALALASERLALGFIFLAGLLTAATVYCLSCRWASPLLAAAMTLLFLLTPLVFWQISSSGSPDIFMAFFLSTALLVLVQSLDVFSWQRSLIIGILTGAVAGAKYTGCLIAAPVAIALFLEFRSLSAITPFLAGTLLGGVWTYLKNILWLGNPFFPFLASKSSPHLVTSFALDDLAMTVGQHQQHSLYKLFPFLLFAGSRQGFAPGFFEFYGPAVLAFAPLVVLGLKGTRQSRAVTLIWLLSGAAIFFTSGLARFMLPLFPLALAAVARGIQFSGAQRWKYVHIATSVLLGLMYLSGLAGLAVYGAKPIQAALGLQTRQAYLEVASPDYPLVSFVNRSLASSPNPGRALVFFRHTYYLQFPYLNGDPANSFEIDPARMTTAESWESFLRAHNIAFVVRSGGYPTSLAAPLLELEHRGVLVPYLGSEVQNLTGKRIEQSRIAVRLVILKVN